jgi:hypothetical protein
VIRRSASAGVCKAKIALRGADRNAGVALSDCRDRLVVPSQAVALERRSLPVVIGRVLGVEFLQVGGNHVRDRLNVRGVIPAVRVVALSETEEISNRQDDPPGRWVGSQQLRCPWVVSDPVDDRELRGGQSARIGRGRLVGVRVLSGVDDDAVDRCLGAGDLGRNAAPEVLGGDDLQATGAGTPGRCAAASGEACDCQQQRCEVPELHGENLPQR